MPLHTGKNKKVGLTLAESENVQVQAANEARVEVSIEPVIEQTQDIKVKAYPKLSERELKEKIPIVLKYNT